MSLPRDKSVEQLKRVRNISKGSDIGDLINTKNPIDSVISYEKQLKKNRKLLKYTNNRIKKYSDFEKDTKKVHEELSIMDNNFEDVIRTNVHNLVIKSIEETGYMIKFKSYVLIKSLLNTFNISNSRYIINSIINELIDNSFIDYSELLKLNNTNSENYEIDRLDKTIEFMKDDFHHMYIDYVIGCVILPPYINDDCILGSFEYYFNKLKRINPDVNNIYKSCINELIAHYTDYLYTNLDIDTNNRISIYRGVDIKDNWFENIKSKRLGIYWSFDDTVPYSFSSDVIFSSKVNLDSIDWVDTIYQMILYAYSENEIRLYKNTHITVYDVTGDNRNLTPEIVNDIIKTKWKA